MKRNKEMKKRILAFAAYLFCIILAILLFSFARYGGTGNGDGKDGTGAGNGTGNGTGSSEGSGANNGSGNGNSSPSASASSGASENPQKTESSEGGGSGEEKKESQSLQKEAKSEPQSEDQSSEETAPEAPKIDMTPVRNDISEDQKKIWKSAVETTKKLCKYQEKTIFPEFGAKETEIIAGKSDDGIPCYKVKGFYVSPNKHGKDVKIYFECNVFFFQNNYMTNIPLVKE